MKVEQDQGRIIDARPIVSQEDGTQSPDNLDAQTCGCSGCCGSSCGGGPLKPDENEVGGF